MPEITARLSTALADRYKIERHLGEGGMATVYLAEDLKHKRKVAVKVLRPELAAVLGAERFVQEITTTANLQHPHILPLFDSGEADSFLYYVMPYVEGETLRDKLNRETQLGIDEAVRITTEVADALDYAHRHNVIHRDIKPENILLHDGRPMVADFGIALAVSAAAGGRMTETGLSLGTPHYMSPEQATAEKDLTNRSDIYSLGSVLYEMVTGEPPHMGNSAQQIIMKIVTDVPRPVTELRKSVPPHVAAATAKALEKLPADRFEDAATFAEALTDARKMPVTAAYPVAESASHNTSWRTVLPWLVSALAITVAVLVATREDSLTETVVGLHRFVVTLPLTVELDPAQPWLALTGDGTQLLIELEDDAGMLVRDMAELESQLITEGGEIIRGNQPVPDPDGGWVAFYERSQGIRRVPIGGGTPIPVSDGAFGNGGTWDAGGAIIWERGGELWRFPAEGGPPERLTTLDASAGEMFHWYPQILPGGTKLLFSTYRTPIDSGRLEVLDLDTRERTIVHTGGQFGRYVATGHILYQRYETMYAVPFDLDRLETTGPAVPVLEGVAYSVVNAQGGFAVSDNGTLAYIKSSVWDPERQLVLVDREGNEQLVMDDWGRYDGPALSPNGDRLAFVSTPRGKPDIWVYDMARGGQPTPVTRSDYLVRMPLWTLDGTRIIYQSERLYFDLFWRDFEAAAPAAAFLSTGSDLYPSSISPNGREMAVVVFGDTSDMDIYIVSTEGEREAREFQATAFREMQPVFSHDGRWIAYVSNESGRPEIWLQSYPDTAGERRRISAAGGNQPRWGTDGELFYVRGNAMVAVQIEPASGLAGKETVLFEGPYRFNAGPFINYDVTRDGQRFLLVKERPGSVRNEVVVVLNWFEELKAKVGN